MSGQICAPCDRFKQRVVLALYMADGSNWRRPLCEDCAADMLEVDLTDTEPYFGTTTFERVPS